MVVLAYGAFNLWHVWSTGRSDQARPVDAIVVGGAGRRRRDRRWASRAGRLAVVDYKTGKPPSQDDVLRGEAVQLSSYALLLETPVEQLDYVELAKDNVKPTTCAQGEDLQPLLQQIEQRLTVIDRALQDGVPLPAWGDDKVCGYCEFSGLCRRDTWLQDNDKHD